MPPPRLGFRLPASRNTSSSKPRASHALWRSRNSGAFALLPENFSSTMNIRGLLRSMRAPAAVGGGLLAHAGVEPGIEVLDLALDELVVVESARQRRDALAPGQHVHG